MKRSAKKTFEASRGGAGALAVALMVLGCGGGSHSPDSSAQEPVDVTAGEMGVLAGAGERATDAIDADGDGNPDVLPALVARFDSPLDVTVAGDGRLFIVDWNGHKIRVLDGDNQVEFVMGTGIEGDACEQGFHDGECPALAAEFNHPTDVIADPEGRLVVAAWHNSKIKRFDPKTGLVEDMCGTGGRKYEGDGGPCRDDQGNDLVTFDLPSGVVYDTEGNLFISDQANQVIRRLGTDGIIKAVAGHCPTMGGFGCPEGRGYAGDGGPATEAMIASSLGQGTDPQGKIAIDGDNNIYIADTGNNVVRKVTPGSDGVLGDGDPSEEIISTVAGTGDPGYSGDGGAAVDAQLSSPTDVEVGPDGSLFIADRGNSCIRRVGPEGTITTVAGRCGQPGDGEFAAAELATEPGLRQPYGIALDDTGRLYIADTLNHCIRQVALDL